MPKINFPEVEDGTGFTPLPPGTYPCILRNIEEKKTRGGDEMWSLQWEVASGEKAGRKIFDNLVFSIAALPRVKLVCKRLGIDTGKEVDLVPSMLMEKAALITVEITEYEGKERNQVLFDGVEARDQAEDELPF